MKAKIFIAITALSVILCGAIFAQKESIRDLGIGDPVPDIEIKDVINHTSPTVHIADFKGKLLIIDFWSTWCAPCVASFPKLDSLQRKFNDRLQILPVTYEEKEKVSDFLNKMKKINSLFPVTATNDTILSKYFYHTSIPHYVWINESGKVIAITEGKELNEMNVTKIIEGNNESLPVKKDDEFSVLYRVEGLFTPALQVKYRDKDSIALKRMYDKDIMIRSALTGYVEGLEPGIKDARDIITARNMKLEWLYRFAITKLSLTAECIVEVPDPLLYEHLTSRNPDGTRSFSRGLETLAWMRENTYCYELKVPPQLMDQKHAIMLNELNQYFGAMYGIEGVREKRNVPYLALVKISQDDKLATKGGEFKAQFDKFSLQLQNSPLSNLIKQLAFNLQTQRMDLIDETGYSNRVDIELNCQLSSLGAVNKELAKGRLWQ